jgi:hypothetical protein
MAYNYDKYTRSQPPALPDSEKEYLQNELRKLEKVLQAVYDAIKDIDKRLTTGGL